MNTIIKDIEDLAHDLKAAIANAQTAKQDIDRGINVNHTAKAENEPKEKTIERLFHYLIDAYHDVDRMIDNMKDVHAKLDDLLEAVEYENIRQEALK